MSSLFVSYAREDQAFVRRLHAALAADGFRPWVDWEGIPPADEWLRKIHRAIEAADAMVVVISPDSLASVVCRQEIAHAQLHHKRLLPVVARDPGEALHDPGVPEVVRRLNWIFFDRPGDDFDAAVRRLAEAARTDLPWVEAHTRLLVRALEWTARGRDESFLLVRTDLAEAEAWLARAPDRKPAPTQAHSDYIVASRAAAVRRQRRRTRLAGAAAVLIGLGAIAATWQYAVAELRRQDSQSRQLAAAAPALFDTAPRQGLLLAAQAVALSPTPQALHTLLDLLDRVRGADALLPGRHGPAAAAMSDDGRRVAAVACEDGDRLACRRAELRVWATDPVRLVARAPVPAQVDAVRLSPDGREVAVRGCCAPAPGGATGPASTGAEGRPVAMRFRLPSPDDAGAPPVTLVAVATWDVPADEGEPAALAVPAWPDAPAPAGTAPSSPTLRVDRGRDGPVLTLGGGPGAAGRTVARIALAPGTVRETRVRPDGTLAAALACQPMASGALCQDVQLAVVDATEAPVATARFTAPWPDWIRDIALLPGVPRVLSGGCAWHDYRRCRGGELRVWDARSDPALMFQPAPIPVPGGGVEVLRLSQDGTRLLLQGEDGLLSLWRLDPSRLAADERLASHLATVGDPAAAPRTACRGVELPVALAPVAAGLQDPRALCAALADVDAWAGAERTSAEPAHAAAATPDGRHVALGGCVAPRPGDIACTAGRLAVWAVRDGRLEPVFATDLPGTPVAVGLSADGRTVGAATCPQAGGRTCPDATLRLWRTDAGPGAGPVLAEPVEDPTAVALSPDGRQLAVGRCTRRADAGGADRPCAAARIDHGPAAPGAQRVALDGHAAFVEALAFDDDGRRLASGGADGRLGVWDLRRGEPVGPVVPGPAAPVGHLRFLAPDDLAVQPASADTPAFRWQVGAARAMAVACRVAMGPLPDADRRRHLGDDVVADPCRPADPPLAVRIWRRIRAAMPATE